MQRLVLVLGNRSQQHAMAVCEVDTFWENPRAERAFALDEAEVLGFGVQPQDVQRMAAVQSCCCAVTRQSFSNKRVMQRFNP